MFTVASFIVEVRLQTSFSDTSGQYTQFLEFMHIFQKPTNICLEKKQHRLTSKNVLDNVLDWTRPHVNHFKTWTIISRLKEH